MIGFFLIIFLQNKIAKDADTLKFEEEDLILKVGECMEVKSFGQNDILVCFFSS